MKRAIAIILALAMILSFSACVGGGGKANDPNVGKYIGYQVDIFGWEPIDKMYDLGENYVELNTGGKGVFCLNGEKTNVKWKLDGENLTMTSQGIDCTGTLKDGVIITDYFGVDMMISFLKEGMPIPENIEENEGEPEDETAPAIEYWTGDWYGWWIISSAEGKWAHNVDNFWDVCATIEEAGDNTCTFTAWDNASEEGEIFCSATMSLSDGVTAAGCMISESGWFLNEYEIGYAQWIVDPGDSEVSAFDHMIMIKGSVVDPEDENNKFTYLIFLRPWGMEWEDVRSADTTDMPYQDMMPASYEAWYLPRIKDGMNTAPLSFA